METKNMPLDIQRFVKKRADEIKFDVVHDKARYYKNHGYDSAKAYKEVLNKTVEIDFDKAMRQVAFECSHGSQWMADNSISWDEIYKAQHDIH